MKKLITILTILITTSQAWACSCIGEINTQEELKGSDLVIVGTVIDSQIVRIWSDTTLARSLYNQGLEVGLIDSTTNYIEWKKSTINIFD